jgi:ATP-dependent DNA helicase RecQ
VAADSIDSTLNAEEIRAAWSRIKAKQTKLLFVAPERFTNETFLQNIKSLDVSLVAVDEAHCISQWGHAFRPDYLRLRSVVKELFPRARFLGLTATATPQVAEEMAHQFGVDAAAVVRTTFHRPNLQLRCSVLPSEEAKLALLVNRLRTQPPGPTIVYCTLQREAQDLATALQKQQLPADVYHAGLPAEQRKKTQEWFMAPGNDNGIVCATIAFGMGIDKPNIRYVYHYCLSKSLEGYAQVRCALYSWTPLTCRCNRRLDVPDVTGSRLSARRSCAATTFPSWRASLSTRHLPRSPSRAFCATCSLVGRAH